MICGRWLNGSKKVCKEHEMGNWIPYFEKRFSYPEVRTAQRFMKVARQVDLEETPALACLGKTALYKQKDTEKDNETKAKSKPDNTNIIDKLNRSATSFMKNVDLVLNDRKTFRSYQDELSEIIKEVEEKLAALEELKKSTMKKAVKKKNIRRKKT